MDFNSFWTLFKPDKEFENRMGATQRAWNNCSPAKQSAIIAWLQTHGSYKGRNPYFFILDFKPQQQTMSFSDYYKKYGTTVEVDVWKRKYIPEEEKTIYVRIER